jgi:hypothetical protein
MAKLQLLENFTIEVPKSDGTFDEIKGQLAPSTKQFELDLELKYKGNIDKAKTLQKKNNKLIQLQQKINNISKRIEINPTNELLLKQQEMMDKAYDLSDIVESLNEELSQVDHQEIRAKEHIQARLIADNDSKAKIISLCDKYSYKLIFDTILEDIEEGKQKEKKS